MASWPPPSELEAAWNDRADASETNPNSGPRAADVLPMPTVSGTSTSMPAAKKKKPAKRGVFVCPEPQCGKTFPRSFALRRHQRIHTGTKPYACDFAGCAQRFNTSGNLSRHKRIHSGERPYPCIFATCGKRFNTSTKLKRHMRIHFPEGHNLFRCVGVECSWSCDNYKEFAQHQKLHHNVIVGAQSSNAARAGSAVAVNAAPPAKDNEYFSAADTTSRLEYDAPPAAAAPYHPTGAFLYGPPYDKAKAAGAPPPAQPPRHKPMGQFFASDLNALASLPALHKDKKPPHEDLAAGAYAAAASGAASLYARGKPPAAAFPSAAPPYRASAAFDSFDGGYARPAVSAGYAPHYGGHHDVDDEEDPDDGYGHGHGHGQPQHQPTALPHALHGHVLRPPPQGSEDGGGFKLGAFQVPPPMNPAAPEFTGEELSVVLQLMDGNYC